MSFAFYVWPKNLHQQKADYAVSAYLPFKLSFIFDFWQQTEN